MTIIGITGTYGSGKGTVVKYLVKKRGFVHYSVSKFLTQIVKKRKLPINRQSLIDVGNSLRKKHGPSYLAETLFKKAKRTGKNCVIESLRNPAEVESLKEIGKFYLFAVDANPKIRYKRIRKRGGIKDNISYQKFIRQEKGEMSSKNKASQNLSKTISMADYKYENNGTIKEFYNEIERIINEIEK